MPAPDEEKKEEFSPSETSWRFGVGAGRREK